MAAADLVRLDAYLAPFAALVDTLDPADPLLAALRQRIAVLRAMVDGTAPAADVATAQAARTAVQTALVAFIDRWKRDLTRTLLAQLPELPPLHHALATADWFSPDGFTSGVELGPLTLRIGLDQVTIAVDASLAGGGTAPLAPFAIGPSRLDRVAASLSGPFPGDGALRVLADGCSGALRLPLGAVVVDALASLRRTATGGPSFVAIIGAAFTPGIQLSFGFALDRVGGVIGIERRIDQDALSLGIRSGSATEVLFSPAGADLQRRLASAEALFPPAPGQHVVGPLFGLAWLSLGPDAALVHVDVGVLVQLGGPVTIVIVGSGKLTLGELLRIRADLAGSVDITRGRVAVDVSLVEARVLGAFRATGDAAFRATTSEAGATVFSAGGFYPGFDPRPAEIGPLRRLSLGTDIPTPGLDIRIEGYFAVTSNTIQLGGRLEVVFDAALIVARGSVGLDALVQFRPFHFHAHVYGQVSVEFLGETFCGVRVEATVDGPGPMSVAARLTIETFLKDIPWNETFTFGAGAADRADRIPDLVAEVAARAAQPGALRASAPDDPAVVLEPLAVTGVVVGPLGELVWSQRHSPLHMRCDRFESEPLDPPGQGVLVDVGAPAVKRHEEKEPFAPGSFLDLPDNLALHVPAFDPQVAGIRIGFDDKTGDAQLQPPATRVLLLPVTVSLAQALRNSKLPAMSGQAWLRSVADVGLAAPRVWNDTVQVTTLDETWRTSDGAPHTNVTRAWQHARHLAGGVPLHAADPAIDTGSV
jgi:hypothetical protein